MGFSCIKVNARRSPSHILFIQYSFDIPSKSCLRYLSALAYITCQLLPAFPVKSCLHYLSGLARITCQALPTSPVRACPRTKRVLFLFFFPLQTLILPCTTYIFPILDDTTKKRRQALLRHSYCLSVFFSIRSISPHE